MASTPLDSNGNPIPVAPGISPDKTALSGGNSSLITGAGGPNMTPPAPAAQPPQDSSTPAKQQGFFSKIGGFLQQHGDVINDIANHLSAAAGNYAPLEMAHQQAQLKLQQQNAALQSQLGQSTLQTQALQQDRLRFQNANEQTPQQAADLEVDTKLRGAPRTYLAPDQTVHTALYNHGGYQDATVSNPAAKTDPNAPPTMPMVSPQAAGAHVGGYDANGNYVEQFYSPGGIAKGAPQPAPMPASAGLVPGMGKMNPLDAGATGHLPPNPRDFPLGNRDPGFQAAYAKYLQTASNTKQANTIAVAGARGAAFNATKPITTLDNNNQDVITTMAQQHQQNPGQPIIAGNQAGAAGLGQKRATFAEVDQNLKNVQQYLPSLTNDLGSRAAFATALSPGTGMVSNIAESAGLQHLSPDQQNLVFSIRNLKQGMTGLKNILSSSGVSDKRVAILESEVPNEADLLTGDPAVVQRKLATMTSVYDELKRSYPQLMTGGAPAVPQPRPNIPMAQPAGNAPAPQSQVAPPTMPPTAPVSGFAAWKASKQQQPQQ